MAVFFHSLQAQMFLDHATAFIGGHGDASAHPQANSPKSFDKILNLSRKDEKLLRNVLADLNPSQRQFLDPTTGLVFIFKAPLSLQSILGRQVESFKDRFSKYMIPLLPKDRRSDGSLSIVNTIEDFLLNWRVMTEGALDLVNWSNIIVAGGAICACLLPIGPNKERTIKALRKCFHYDMFPDSDIDIFLYAMTEQQVS
jgi:hypothetical protein